MFECQYVHVLRAHRYGRDRSFRDMKFLGEGGSGFDTMRRIPKLWSHYSAFVHMGTCVSFADRFDVYG